MCVHDLSSTETGGLSRLAAAQSSSVGTRDAAWQQRRHRGAPARPRSAPRSLHAAALEHVEHGLEQRRSEAARMHHALRPFARHRAQALRCARSRASGRPARSRSPSAGRQRMPGGVEQRGWLMRCGARPISKATRPPIEWPATASGPSGASSQHLLGHRAERGQRCRSAARCLVRSGEGLHPHAARRAHTAWSRIKPGSSSRVGRAATGSELLRIPPRPARRRVVARAGHGALVDQRVQPRQRRQPSGRCPRRRSRRCAPPRRAGNRHMLAARAARPAPAAPACTSSSSAMATKPSSSFRLAAKLAGSKRGMLRRRSRRRGGHVAQRPGEKAACHRAEGDEGGASSRQASSTAISGLRVHSEYSVCTAAMGARHARA